jgi:hypothetical protein
MPPVTYTQKLLRSVYQERGTWQRDLLPNLLLQPQAHPHES